MKKEIWKCKKCESTKNSSHKNICHNCYMRDWTKKNPDKVNYIIKNYRKRNPKKKRVWDKAGRNIALKGFCEVCKVKKAEDRHHPDYSKPLEVILVCKKCHKNIHSNSPQDNLNYSSEDTILKGMQNALEDVKKGDYHVLTKGEPIEDTQKGLCECGHEKGLHIEEHGCIAQVSDGKYSTKNCSCKKFKPKKKGYGKKYFVGIREYTCGNYNYLCPACSGKKGCKNLIFIHFGKPVYCGDFILDKIQLCEACSGKVKPIILDDNELSIMKYAEEYPENWKKICKALDKSEEKQC